MRHSRLAFSLQAAGEDLGQIKHIQHLQCLKFTQVRGIQGLGATNFVDIAEHQQNLFDSVPVKPQGELNDVLD